MFAAGIQFAVSDVVTRGEIPAEIRKNILLWVGCVAGALDENEYREKLTTAGFTNIGIEPTRIYRTADALSFLIDQGHRRGSHRSAGRWKVHERVCPRAEAASATRDEGARAEIHALVEKLPDGLALEE